MLEDVEVSVLVKSLWHQRSNRCGPGRAHGQWACSVRNLVSRVLHRTWPNASASRRRKRPTPAIAIDFGDLNERDDQLQETAEAPSLFGKCDRDCRSGAAIAPTKGTDEYAIAE